MRLGPRLAAETVGTFWLVLAGCGTAVLAGEQVGYLGVALAFGLAVLTMAYAVGHVSGGHFNPAVTLGSPESYTLVAAALTEIVLTAVFVFVILGVTDRRAPVGFTPLAIGLTLTAVHLVSIPVTNTSVNPARSLGVAWFDTAALGQSWLFVVAPLVGAAVAGLAYAVITGVDRRDVDIDGGAAV
ncbi:aquaporin [Nocardioides zeae]|uniref:Aquaporin n=1 Tax=Nocardioides zeae TaxID=1457234 RepID=A0A6P0HI83_9ACTN|nr:aquaporin [Nocardioides zeae]